MNSLEFHQPIDCPFCHHHKSRYQTILLLDSVPADVDCTFSRMKLIEMSKDVGKTAVIDKISKYLKSISIKAHVIFYDPSAGLESDGQLSSGTAHHKPPDKRAEAQNNGCSGAMSDVATPSGRPQWCLHDTVDHAVERCCCRDTIRLRARVKAE